MKLKTKLFNWTDNLSSERQQKTFWPTERKKNSKKTRTTLTSVQLVGKHCFILKDLNSKRFLTLWSASHFLTTAGGLVVGNCVERSVVGASGPRTEFPPVEAEK